MPIEKPVGVAPVKSGGRVDAAGTLSLTNHPLRAVWGAIFHGKIVTIPENPWDSKVPAFKQGTFTEDQDYFNWKIDDVPGAQGGCDWNTFVLWYVREDESEIHKEHSFFRGDSTGQGCSGSGSGSGASLNGMVSGAAASVHMSQIAPQSYRLIPLALGNPLGESPHAKPPAHSQLPAAAAEPVLLEFDELRSSPTEMWWRSPRNRLDLVQWQLQIIAAGDSQMGIVTLLQPSDSLLSTRVWTCPAWNMLKPNELVAAAAIRAAGVALPLITVEPAA